MSAVGYTADGERLQSNAFIGEFVSPEVTSRFIFVVIGIVVVIVLGRFLFFRQGSSRPKKGYGAFGAAVCSNCGRPFSRHWWGLNLLTSKFDRCPHCGKWQGTRIATADQLAAAEAFHNGLDKAGPNNPESDIDSAEKLRKQLDDSRFQDY
jgi:hypothetical protein